MGRCPCSPATVCVDLLPSDLNMPEVQGLDFAEGLPRKTCVAPHIGLISVAWSPAAHACTVRVGCRLFRKPFVIVEPLAWFDSVEVQIDPRQALLD